MSISIYVRELAEGMWIASLDPVSLVPSLDEAMAFPNIVAAQEAVGAADLFPMRFAAFAADPCSSSAPLVLCEIETLEEIPQVPLRGAVELMASLRKSSKYFYQFSGWKKVERVISPSYGDAYCFRVDHNAYRHEDLIFAVKLPGQDEIVRLDKWVQPVRKAVAA